MEKRTIIKVVVDRNIYSVRNKIGKFITGINYDENADTLDLQVANTIITAINNYQDGIKQAYRIYGNHDYDQFADVIEIEMIGEGTKEIVFDFVKRIESFFSKTKDCQHYNVLEYGLEVR